MWLLGSTTSLSLLQAFKGIKSLIVSSLFNAANTKGQNPLWPGIKYDGPDPDRPLSPTEQRQRAEAVLQRAIIDLTNPPCRYIESGLCPVSIPSGPTPLREERMLYLFAVEVQRIPACAGMVSLLRDASLPAAPGAPMAPSSREHPCPDLQTVKFLFHAGRLRDSWSWSRVWARSRDPLSMR